MRAYYPSHASTNAPSTTGWAVSGLIFPICAYYLLNPNALLFLDSASVLLYQAGHLMAQPVGGNATYLGGTVAQIAVPVGLVLFFYLHQYRFGFQVFLFWLGQNLVNLSLQVAKPSALYTSTLGHQDWQQLLTQLDMLEYDLFIGALFFAAGSISFLLAIVAPAYMKP